jgi:hypothetical protein
MKWWQLLMTGRWLMLFDFEVAMAVVEAFELSSMEEAKMWSDWVRWKEAMDDE